MTPYKTAFITGASSGLGRGLATWFAQRGVTVHAAARRVAELEKLRDEVGERIVPVELDVSDADATEAAVRRLDSTSGGLDLVIANAGVGGEMSARRVNWSKVHQGIKVNVSGAVATLCGALPGMVERKRGHLVGISSIAGLLALPRSATYGASKAFLSMWLESVRLDVASEGVQVTTIQPGFVKSEMTDLRPKETMPFLLETADAVERMGRAILRKDEVFAFPWQTATAARVAGVLPRRVRAAVLRRVR